MKGNSNSEVVTWLCGLSVTQYYSDVKLEEVFGEILCVINSLDRIFNEQ